MTAWYSWNQRRHGLVEYAAKLLVTLRLPRSFKAMTMQFTECR